MHEPDGADEPVGDDAADDATGADDSAGAEEQPPLEAPDKGELKTLPSLILVNTGHGKGKSTAAFGTILRAVALGWPVAVVQFLKSGDWRVGEEKICRELGVDWYAAGDGFTWNSDDIDESRAKAQAAWEMAANLLVAGDHRLLVLDEISYAMIWHWIDAGDVAEALSSRPEQVNVILTGRDMPQPIIDVAHTVTEMTKVKHAFDAGYVAKKGIDY
ncbi:MAG: cob(I)yrinic acid a,c-diamide adenosyltransferase [Actinomycetota bacterium]